MNFLTGWSLSKKIRAVENMNYCPFGDNIEQQN